MMIAVARQIAEPQQSEQVIRLADIDNDALTALLARHGLNLVAVADGERIPGSYWGEPEAGVIADRVFARADTPVHSVLHEASHLIVAGPERRADIHTDASDCDQEEDATCYLQIVLAEQLYDVGSDRLMTDMDAWGYSFRLGSACAWFKHDAGDAREWLRKRGIVDASIDAPNLAAQAVHD
ncbi:MAG: hypothetical protein WBP11_15675 [Dokdonella sp.]